MTVLLSAAVLSAGVHSSPVFKGAKLAGNEVLKRAELAGDEVYVFSKPDDDQRKAKSRLNTYRTLHANLSRG